MPKGTFGNSGRSLQFRAEFFNLTNHSNFIAKRSERLTSGTLGRFTSAEDPRIQFGISSEPFAWRPQWGPAGNFA
jgi:hypothetical protein